ncbi:hypothetical protein CYMTET_13080 [Cymbomonas tetramitiformis]|uniref:Uncharacterized protein n=1 Tax=Cymbomonas tetramitiformis TaxID=36881 RepID=A0AAE0LBS0_9CHLO|nr:hypothetical protein CYMTET_13080 [Cymbomonas tetramitiformis]
MNEDFDNASTSTVQRKNKGPTSIPGSMQECGVFGLLKPGAHEEKGKPAEESAHTFFHSKVPQNSSAFPGDSPIEFQDSTNILPTVAQGEITSASPKKGKVPVWEVDSDQSDTDDDIEGLDGGFVPDNAGTAFIHKGASVAYNAHGKRIATGDLSGSSTSGFPGVIAKKVAADDDDDDEV